MIPLQPLTAQQRLAWLADGDELLCVRPFAEFRAGRRYALAVVSVSGDREITRRRYQGGVEKVTLTGSELAVLLRDERGERHAFSPYGGDHAANPHRRHHRTADLLKNFSIPAVPDAAEVFGERYRQYRALLQNLVSHRGTESTEFLIQ